MEYVTRDQLANSLKIDVKTLMKHIKEYKIELVQRERISPKKQLEILEKLTGYVAQSNSPDRLPSLPITPDLKKKK